MRIKLPTIKETKQINQQRETLAAAMQQGRYKKGQLMALEGPCAADRNRHSDGQFATVRHISNLAQAAHQTGIPFFARLNGAKPRTRNGTTGLINEPGGAQIYGEQAKTLTKLGISMIAEIMNESDAVIAGPWLTGRWVGTRNLGTGTRQLMRPTEEELDMGLPAPAFVKSSMDGSLSTVIDALHVIRSKEPKPDTRFTLTGLKEVVTHANPNTGLILRGSARRPEGLLDKILATEILNARHELEKEFEDYIPIIVDLSHGHANWEGGGEKGQLAIADSLYGIINQGVSIDGVMAETYLLAGKQPDGGAIPGQSQVDGCISENQAIRLFEKWVRPQN